MSEKESVELLKQVAKGDEKAFAEFFRLYENRLYRFILSKLNDSFEASDILNETFLEVWRKAGTFEGRSKVSTWLFGIAYYKTMDRMRKKKPMLIDEDNFPEIVDETPDAVSCLISEDDAGHVRHCLETLKEAHRSVMQLAFFEDMAYGEIAKIVDCPENTVKTRMFHAKQAMKHCLQGRMEERS
ncbi:MAG: RNA polymerase sigma factor [Micavibrio sp.]|nr:MAG: RNA polymerase sigma factor [Micavibrio sp.]